MSDGQPAGVVCLLLETVIIIGEGNKPDAEDQPNCCCSANRGTPSTPLPLLVSQA